MKMIKYFFLTAAILFLGAYNSTSKADGDSNSANEQSVNNTTKKDKKMGTIKMTKTDFLAKVHDYEKDMETWKYLGDKPAVIDFYADWCGPCKQIAPILEELGTEYQDKVYIYKVNVDEEQELAAIFGIRSIPTMLFVPMEGQPQFAAGAASKTEMKKVIDEILLSK